MIRVKITQPVFIRKGPARSFAVLGNIFPSGKELLMDGKEKGENWKGIDSWFFKINDKNEKQYYWGGGIEVIEEGVLTANPNPITSVLDYSRTIGNIPELWRNAAGRNITVAVIDRGFDTDHKDIKNNIAATFNAFNNSNIIESSHHHGNNVAGLIAANANAGSGIKGVASQAKLVLIKVSNDNGVILPEFVKRGIDFALNTANADIINISLGLDKIDYNLIRNDFLNLFNTADQKKTLVVASAGENSGLLSTQPSLILPANETSCLAIGTINAKFLRNNPSPAFHNRVSYVMPDLPMMSASSDDRSYNTISESSMAAAMLSGVAALLFSHKNGRLPKNEVIAEMNRFFDPVNNQISLSQTSIFKL